MKQGFLLLLLIFALLSGCAIEQHESSRQFPLKIGLLADSQITSQNGFSDFHYRSKSADALVDVSIRPPALECYLAREMLTVALDKLTNDAEGEGKGVDVILYLGDAANSGGTDEIETVLEILGQHRQQTSVPIFIIIGNHDYLGAGNVVSPGIRFAMLNQVGKPDNPALTKYEVLKKFSEFNHANNRISANTYFRYVDNFPSVERNKELDHETGLYLGGVLTYTEAGKDDVEIFLLDSSDYKDAPPWSEVADIGFYGVIGSISFKDEEGRVSQAGYFKEFAYSSSPQFRFLASHYPKDHLDRVTFTKPNQVPFDVTNHLWDITEGVFSVPTFSKTMNQNLKKLLTPQGGNYWLSAHTHVKTPPRPQRFVVGGLVGEEHFVVGDLIGKEYFDAVNIGSTTDYRAHVVIVERYERGRNNRLDNFIGFRDIPLFDYEATILTAIPEAIGDFGRQHADDKIFQSFAPALDEWTKENQSGGPLDISGSLFGAFNQGCDLSEEDLYWIDMGAMLLGLNKTYRQDGWTDTQKDTAVTNLRYFIDEYASRTGSSRDEIIAYLGLLAGAYEKKILPAKCGFSSENLKQLCAEPK